MKTRIHLLSIALLLTASLSAQKIFTRTGYVKFYSEAPIENIEAVNKQVSSVIEISDGSFAFLVPIKGFVFEKALMQEHFNENYMESGKYPKGSFQGKIKDIGSLNFEKDGEYQATFTGTMNIHGVEKELTEKATITIKGGKASLNAKFNIRPEDYGVKIPAGKRDNISEIVEVTVKMDYEKK
ncbi:YceI family protein [Owenweeksia hongkongensis]|uniref:YceI family protein n=1 Tax=Owenweeksia hongkongensis TaxID=253245 RepID=UPI003A8D7E33